MNYNFPTITHIDDVLPAIKDSPEFIVVNKEDYIVINYVVMNEDTFPAVNGETYCPGCKEMKSMRDNCGSQRCPDFLDVSSVRRECRGLIFDMDGNIINRRYHKFFNLQEKTETDIQAIDWSEPHMILEKLDGSMVSPFIIHGNLRWSTKMGITDTSMQAEVFVASRQNYTDLAEELLGDDYCPIFEWCSNKNRIVLDYPEDNLILTAVRHNKTGKYDDYETLLRIGKLYNVPVVKAYDLSDKSIEEVVETVRAAENTEGIVVRFATGHMVKVKSDQYVKIHKIKSLLGQERDVVSLILNNQIDDLLPVLSKEDIEKLEKFRDHMIYVLESHSADIVHQTQYYYVNMDRKTFALEAAPKLNALWRSLVFQFWGKKINEQLTFEAIVAIILKNCGSNASYAKVKEAFLKEVDYV